MRRVAFSTITLISCQIFAATPKSAVSRVPNRDISFADTYRGTPIVFEPNLGQAPAGIDFVSQVPGRSLLLSSGEARLILAGKDQTRATVRMKLSKSRAAAADLLDRLPGVSNYFLGNDATKWYSAVPHFARIRYRNVYPGIDLEYYGKNQKLEYDFIVKAGADPSQIEMAFDGMDHMRVASNGDLVFHVSRHEIRQERPKIYQMIDGRKVEVAGGYRVKPGNRVELALARYDRSRDLIIDPVIQYATYFGGSQYDAAVTVATDAQGNVYMSGVTNSTRFTATDRAQAIPGGESDAFVVKFSSSLESMMYFTYFGGSGTEIGNSLAVDGQGNAYIAGYTTSANLPVRNGAQTTAGGDLDAFVAKINPTGTAIVYSSYVGGALDDFGNGLAVDSAGNAYVTGWTLSANFPVRGGYQSGRAGGGGDTFITKIAPDGRSFIYSTYVGSNGDDLGTGIAVDAAGAAYVTGSTTSTILATANAAQKTRGGDQNDRRSQDAFVYKLSPSGNTLEYATYIGGADNDLGYRVAVDGEGNAYVTGYTKSANFPTRSAFQSTLAGGTDAFLTKVSPRGDSFIYSTLLGGSGDEYGFGNVVVDSGGSAYITGYTASSNFPARIPVQTSFGGAKYDAFVARVAPAGNALLYSTLIGGRGDDYGYGLALDRQSAVLVAGRTSSPNFPSAQGAIDSGGVNPDPFDMFLLKLSADTSSSFIGASLASVTFAVRSGAANPAPQTINLSSTGLPVSFTAGGSAASGGNWFTVSPDRGSTPGTITVSANVAGLSPGNYTGTITINAPGATNGTLTIPVALSITAAPSIRALNPSVLIRGATDTTVTVSGSGFSSTSIVFVNGNPAPTAFVDSSTLRVTIPPALVAATGTLQITVAVGSEISAAVPLTVSSGGPLISAANIRNAATFMQAPIAPGELITVFGSGFGSGPLVPAQSTGGTLSTSLDETRLLFDGVASPMWYVREGQLSAIVPYSVAGKSSVVLQVEYRGNRSNEVNVSIAPVNPGIFTANSSGTGQAAGQNQDGTSNSASNPIAAGGIVTFYATGSGVWNPSVADGSIITGTDLPKPMLPVSVTIGGQPAEVLYAGAVPGAPGAVLQVNARVPLGITVGPEVPVVLVVGSTQSQAGVTIAIR